MTTLVLAVLQEQHNVHGAPFRAPLLVRLLRRSVAVGDCWIWQGHKTSQGYGYVRRENHGPGALAHRVSYELLVGPIPEGLEIDHLCRTRACINPAHLEPVTCQENIRRGAGLAAANAAKTHCHRGHEFTLENTYRGTGGRRHCRTCVRAWRAARAAA